MAQPFRPGGAAEFIAPMCRGAPTATAGGAAGARLPVLQPSDAPQAEGQDGVAGDGVQDVVARGRGDRDDHQRGVGQDGDPEPPATHQQGGHHPDHGRVAHAHRRDGGIGVEPSRQDPAVQVMSPTARSVSTSPRPGTSRGGATGKATKTRGAIPLAARKRDVALDEQPRRAREADDRRGVGLRASAGRTRMARGIGFGLDRPRAPR